MPFPQLKKATSVDVDRKTGDIYWSDTSEDVIRKGTADGKNVKTIVMHELEMPDGLAIDSTGRKVLRSQDSVCSECRLILAFVDVLD